MEFPGFVKIDSQILFFFRVPFGSSVNTCIISQGCIAKIVSLQDVNAYFYNISEYSDQRLSCFRNATADNNVSGSVTQQHDRKCTAKHLSNSFILQCYRIASFKASRTLCSKFSKSRSTLSHRKMPAFYLPDTTIPVADANCSRHPLLPQLQDSVSVMIHWHVRSLRQLHMHRLRSYHQR